MDATQTKSRMATARFMSFMSTNNNAYPSLLSEVFFLLSLQANGKSFNPLNASFEEKENKPLRLRRFISSL